MVCACLQIASLKIWRIIKIIVGICALICAIIMFTSVVCSYSIAQYIVTAVLTVAAIGILIDSLGWEQVLIKFKEQITRLSSEVDRLELVEKEMQRAVDNLKEENRQYGLQNTRYAEQIKQQCDLLAEQKHHTEEFAKQNKLYADENNRLKIIEKNYRSMLDELTATGSDIKNTSEIIADSAAKIETNTNALETITHEMIVDKFNEIDSNDDGLITKQELIDYAKRRRAIMRMIRANFNK